MNNEFLIRFNVPRRILWRLALFLNGYGKHGRIGRDNVEITERGTIYDTIGIFACNKSDWSWNNSSDEHFIIVSFGSILWIKRKQTYSSLLVQVFDFKWD